MRRLAPAVVTAMLLACLAAPAALAHARFVESTPASGQVLARAPASVEVLFDDSVAVGPGIAAVRNGGGSVLDGRAHAAGRRLTIPLRSGIGEGDYTVRWSVVSDDGHVIEGVVAFGVGLGRAAPAPTLSAGGGAGSGLTAARALFLAGVLAAIGIAAFRALVWPRALAAAGGAVEVARREEAASRVALVAAFSAAIGGASLALLVAPGGTETRFGRSLALGIGLAAVGAAAAEAGAFAPRALRLAALPALGLAVVPALGGHALDSGGARPYHAVVDVLHVAAAGVWLGGVLQLAFVLPYAAPGRADVRSAAIRRFSAVALLTVAVLVATGVLRAVTELAALSQLWSTGYGRTLLVKIGLLVALLALGAASRLGRLRWPVYAELAALVAVVGAVAVLTELRPGRAEQAVVTRPVPVATTAPAPLPPRDALVLARQSGDLAVALAVREVRRRLELTATVLGPRGGGETGLDVTVAVDGRRAEAPPCGPGCYRGAVAAKGPPRRAAVTLAGFGFPARTVRFDLPNRWPAPPAGPIAARAAASYGTLRSLAFDEVLASSPVNRSVSQWQLEAPDRLAYQVRGGYEAVVIGPRRWDRAPGGRWEASPQDPLRVPQPAWGPRSTNARLLGTGRLRGRPVWIVSLLDRRVPAWFTIWIDRRTDLPLDLRMTAAAHFMHERYGQFDVPQGIAPPVGR